MLRLIGIVFLNLWHGVSRKNGAPALMVLLVASITILGISHNSAAETTDRYDDHQSSKSIIASNKSQASTSSTLAFVNPSLGGQSPATDAKLPQDSQPKTAAKDKSTKPTDRSTKPVNTPAASVAKVQLAPRQIVCTDGQTNVSLTYANVILDNFSAKAATSLRWYWEVRLVSGTNDSSQLPIDSTPHVVKATSGTMKLTADNSDTLLSATSEAGYSYEFRLHVTGPTDAVSKWVTVPQSTDSCAD